MEDNVTDSCPGALGPNRKGSSVSSINFPASHLDNGPAELTLWVVTLRWLEEALQAARNAMSANLLNLKSIGIAYQDTIPCYDLQSRFSKELQSIAGEAEKRARQSRAASIAPPRHECRCKGITARRNYQEPTLRPNETPVHLTELHARLQHSFYLTTPRNICLNPTIYLHLHQHPSHPIVAHHRNNPHCSCKSVRAVWVEDAHHPGADQTGGIS